MPNAKPRKGSSNAEEDSQATFALRVLEMLGDTEMLSKIKSALYPDALMAELKVFREEITQLHSVVDEKDRVIRKRNNRVNILEASVDATEQYGRRANLHIQRVVESGTRRKCFRQSAGSHQQHDVTAPTAERRRRRALPSTGTPDRTHTSEDNDRMVQIGKQNYASINARGQLKTFKKTNEISSTTRLHQRRPHQARIVDGLRKLRASKKIADC